jgi:polysaccharide pyruvyl transferase WcaK-like protein
MKNVISLYGHGGSENHGCEAIVRSTCKIIDKDMILFSARKEEDFKYGIDKICVIRNAYKKKLVLFSPLHFYFKAKNLLFKNKNHYYDKEYENLLSSDNKINISIGGDNYCYAGFDSWLSYINYKLNDKKRKTILWGCSIEENLLSTHNIIEDMKKYTLITARETMTFEALKKIGANVKFYPDSAFQLNRFNLPLPKGFVENNTIGINTSPLIMQCERNIGTTMANYKMLIQYIIDTTDMQIALIPHVVWGNNDDRVPLTILYNKFAHTGRVVQIDDHNCMELKGYISRCRMFIGARTHATIAAYSTCVPTLVVGYSVKAKGIAKDIFGTYENYVLPVQSLQSEDDLIKAFKWLHNHENEIRTHLQNFMPSYIEKACQAGDEVRNLMEE